MYTILRVVGITIAITLTRRLVHEFYGLGKKKYQIHKERVKVDELKRLEVQPNSRKANKYFNEEDTE